MIDREKICIYKKSTKVYEPLELPAELKHIFECLVCDGYNKKCKYYTIEAQKEHNTKCSTAKN